MNRKERDPHRQFKQHPGSLPAPRRGPSAPCPASRRAPGPPTPAAGTALLRCVCVPGLGAMREGARATAAGALPPWGPRLRRRLRAGFSSRLRVPTGHPGGVRESFPSASHRPRRPRGMPDGSGSVLRPPPPGWRGGLGGLSRERRDGPAPRPRRLPAGPAPQPFCRLPSAFLFLPPTAGSRRPAPDLCGAARRGANPTMQGTERRPNPPCPPRKEAGDL